MSTNSHPEFEAVIGLEVHCQLATHTKIFCGCRARLDDGTSVADIGANTHVCPVCAGHPGTLPVLNRQVVEYAVKAGLATHCQIRRRSVFARKNYFYPDLPKGYQISQYDQPICEHGWLEVGIPSTGATKRVPITRIHMEEDAGKNVHLQGYSAVNLNRAGVPLVEIVSGPDMSSPEEAGAYLRALHAVVTYIGITDGNMQEGNFRCDANVSVRPVGSATLGTRTEIKNVNSFRFVEKAIEYEIRRQIEVIKGGGKIVLETRTFDSDRGVTTSMRSKEEAHDYRYFPDPDLMPIDLTEDWIEVLRGRLPELPEQKRARYVSELGLSTYDVGVLTASQEIAKFFEETLKLVGAAPAGSAPSTGDSTRAAAKAATNFLNGEVARFINDDGVGLGQSRLLPRHLAEIVRLTQAQEISATSAKQVLAAVWKTGEDVPDLIERLGLRQVSDLSAFEPIIDQVILANPKQVAEFLSGKDKILGFFVGQVMKQIGGKANPALLQELIRQKLSAPQAP